MSSLVLFSSLTVGLLTSLHSETVTESAPLMDSYIVGARGGGGIVSVYALTASLDAGRLRLFGQGPANLSVHLRASESV